MNPRHGGRAQGAPIRAAKTGLARMAAWPGPAPPRPEFRERRALGAASGKPALPGASEAKHSRGELLGAPLDIREVARMLGCSPWTVRQTLLPQGLPHLRFTASGKLVFFTGQVVRWVERRQRSAENQGGI